MGDDNSIKKLSICIPFASDEAAAIACDVLSIDKELKANLLKKSILVNGNHLLVNFFSADLKLLRVASNAFLKNVILVVKTIQLLE